MVNRTKALTDDRNGKDSKCWFYKDRLSYYGPINDDLFDVDIILRKNMHKLVENAVIHYNIYNGGVEFEKI